MLFHLLKALTDKVFFLDCLFDVKCFFFFIEPYYQHNYKFSFNPWVYITNRMTSQPPFHHHANCMNPSPLSPNSSPTQANSPSTNSYDPPASLNSSGSHQDPNLAFPSAHTYPHSKPSDTQASSLSCPCGGKTNHKSSMLLKRKTSPTTQPPLSEPCWLQSRVSSKLPTTQPNRTHGWSYMFCSNSNSLCSSNYPNWRSTAATKIIIPPNHIKT